MLIIWFLVFCASLFVLIKAADYFTECAEKIGLHFKLPPFIIGVTIVAIGTSLPELFTSFLGVIRGQTEIAAANAIGSNIANILLIVGLCALAAGRLMVKRSLINLDLPLLAAATALITVIIWDKQVTFGEGLVALLAYAVYAAYLIKDAKGSKIAPEGFLPGEDLPATREGRHHHRKKLRDLNWKLFALLAFSLICLYFGADLTVRSMTEIAFLIGLPVSAVAMSALAVGTSLPELAVSLSAVKKGKYNIALGNVFGSNMFNVLVVIGLPALFKNLTVDQTTFSLGIPFVIGATVLYVFSGISRKIYKWDGLMYLLIYVLFLAKLFGMF